jgi:hypothetical protein
VYREHPEAEGTRDRVSRYGFTLVSTILTAVRWRETKRERTKQNVSRIAIFTVCHAEQPIPVLFLRFSTLTAYHDSVATVRVAVIPIKTTRVTATVTCALRLGM